MKLFSNLKNTQLIFDLGISALFVLCSMLILRFFLPVGITTDFLAKGYKLVILIVVALNLLFLISWYFNKDFKFKKKIEFPELKDLFLLALPMSPVLDYAVLNIEYLDLFGLFYLIVTTLSFAIFFSIIFPLLFSYFVSIKPLMISGLALSFTIITMGKIADNPEGFVMQNQFLTQFLYLAISFLVVYLLYIFNKNVAYIAVVFFMVTGIFVSFLNYSSENLINAKGKINNKLSNFLSNENNRIIKKKNIYILVYESYAGMETLNHYGFDNSSHLEFLEKKGFQVYHGIYSNGGLSIESTSRILEIDGELSKPGRYYTSGNAFALNILKAHNYKTIGLFKSHYFFGSAPINWDEYYPEGNAAKYFGKKLTNIIFEGEFRFDVFDDFYSYDKYLEQKKKYLSSLKNPSLFYTHNSYPGHSGNSGKCATNEKELYFEGMKKANLEMKNDVTQILKNDSDSIIVLLSDHGPYLTKNCRELVNYDVSEIDKYDIQDRYGAFLSIYWPESIHDEKNNIVITQDIFPAILSNITNNKNLFDQLKVKRKFFDDFKNNIGGINVIDGIISGGKDKGKPLFDKRTYN